MTSSNVPSSVVQRPIEEEMRSSYLDYAMSVIVSRALPDVRDGLKPVHRRILYAMHDAGYYHDRPHKKSARIVGDVLGKYHPHSAEAIYDTMVRMAQPFSMSLTLIDGQGNFGSMDGDKAAASRYTEARLNQASEYLLEDYDKDTVPFSPNYDNSLMMPAVLPARYPNLLVNGAGGIAVGMATNIPTHHLGEVLEACCALLQNPDMSLEELMTYIPGPDFPTGGEIIGRQGILDAYRTGRGSLTLRGTCHIEDIRKDRQAIIVTEIPYQVNKARMVEKIAELVNNKTLEGIADLRDESDRHGVRVVVELKKEVTPEVVLNRLYAQTPLQITFGANMLALVEGRPCQLGLKEILTSFLHFRENVVTRRTQFFLRKARERAHILCGLFVAVNAIDEVVALIRQSPDAAQARRSLLERTWPAQDIEGYLMILGESEAILPDGTYRLTEAQVKAILELRLHRLTGLERTKLRSELDALKQEIEEYLHLLSHRPALIQLMHQEFKEIQEKFKGPRRTRLLDAVGTVQEEDLIEREDMVVTFSVKGYIKRVPLATYRTQKRGGRGRSAMATHEEDILSQVFMANTHTPLLFFTSTGRAFQLKVYELPLATPQSKGKPLVTLLPLEKGETLSTLLPLNDLIDPQNTDIMFATSSGNVRRNALADFMNIRSNGKMAMKLEEKDEKLIAVSLCHEDQDDVLLTTQQGRSIRFEVSDVRQFAGRSSTGVRGIRLDPNDHVVALTILGKTEFSPDEREAYLRHVAKQRRSEEEEEETLLIPGTTPEVRLTPEKVDAMAQQEQFILTLSERGFAKRTSAYAYRRTKRGGAGVATMDISNRSGGVIQSFPVNEKDSILLLTNQGQLMRCGVNDIRIAGRKTKGVIVFRLQKDEKIVSVIPISQWHEQEIEEPDTNPATSS